MLEYFTYKKVKKHQAEKKASTPSTPNSDRKHSPPSPEPAPLLNEEDENFLQRVVSAEGTPPPLPQRPLGLPVAGDSANNNAQMVVHDGNNGTTAGEVKSHDNHKGKSKENEKQHDKSAKKPSRFAFLARSVTKKDKKNDGLHPAPVVTPDEAETEVDDINKVLEDLNLSAVNNRAFSLSKESQQLVQQFTVVLKDLVNGVPTAYDDLTHLLDNSQGQLAKTYEHLPSFLKKLIAQLPDKMKNNLAPELLAVAAEAQALNGSAATSAGGATSFGAAAKSFLKPTSLKDLVTKPGAVVSMLKAIMNALKLRWPAFMGTNVLLSLGLFVLLFVFWYCHKRGKEEREKREKKREGREGREGGEGEEEGEGRKEEVLDDQTPIGGASNHGQAGPSRSQTNGPSSSSSRPTSRRNQSDLDPYSGSRPSSRRSRESRQSRDSGRRHRNSDK